jgi:nucleotide-binding universal stress UspA family protein
MTIPPHIICAVRGHPTSRSTITRAIDMALETGARLTFLHVVTVEFVEHATIGPLSVVYNELREMSEFMMMLLVDRAQRRGVMRTDYVVREGNVRKQLRDFAFETEAQILVMGMPSKTLGRSIFEPEDIQTFVAELEAIAHIKIVLVEPGSGSA